MNNSNGVSNPSEVLVIGKGRSAMSIAACLAISGSQVTVIAEEPENGVTKIQQHLEDFYQYSGKKPFGSYKVVQNIPSDFEPSFAIISGYPELATIRSTIHILENTNVRDLLIAVATDHIPLSAIQHQVLHPENILVMNWTEPAHTTFFLEIVHNSVTDPNMVARLKKTAKSYWGKDPYVVRDELGIRGRMMTAMLREAMYLVEEGYADINDIDRACRNDAGTYLSFAGNFQYMDLMGTYAYGVVMEKLNKELSNATTIAPFFDHALEGGNNGMSNGKGFYAYTKEEVELWESKMRDFSFEISDLMINYPFGYLKKEDESGKIV